MTEKEATFLRHTVRETARAARVGLNAREHAVTKEARRLAFMAAKVRWNRSKPARTEAREAQKRLAAAIEKVNRAMGGAVKVWPPNRVVVRTRLDQHSVSHDFVRRYSKAGEARIRKSRERLKGLEELWLTVLTIAGPVRDMPAQRALKQIKRDFAAIR